MKYNVNFDLELKENPYKGKYIVLEGIDGSGKTTQANMLSDYYKEKGFEIVLTQEPQRKGVIGEIIHDVLQETVAVSHVALQYLFSADRTVHMEEVVIPALQKGKVVISDRNFWSGVAYGIMDRGGLKANKSKDQLAVALSILSFYHQFIAPDVTLYLEIDVNTAIKRLSQLERKAELYENKKTLKSVHDVYDFIYKKFPGAMTRIHGDQNPQKVEEDILKVINQIKK